MTKTDVAVKEQAGSVVKYDPQHPILKAIVDGIIPEVVDPEAMGRAMALRILEASPDEAFELRQATPIEELLSETHSVNSDGSTNLCTPPLQLRGVSWQKSDYDSNGGVYAILDCAIVETGEAKVVTCGGRFLMAGLFRLEMDDGFPTVMQAVQVGRAKQGQSRALRLIRPIR